MMYKKLRFSMMVIMLIFLLNAFPSVSMAEDGDEVKELEERGDVSASIDCGGWEGYVSCLITDPQGKKLGYDPKTNQHYKEIGTFIAIAGSCMGEDCPEFEIPTYEGSIFNLIDGIYSVEVTGDPILWPKGEELTSFFIEIRISNRVQMRYNYLEINGIFDKGFYSKFLFTYSSDPSKPWTLTRLATISSLKQDIMLARKVESNSLAGNMIDNDGIMTSLLKKVEAIEASIGRGNTSAAKGQLNAFINEVVAQKGKHIDEDAVTMLTEDAYYIRNNM